MTTIRTGVLELLANGSQLTAGEMAARLGRHRPSVKMVCWNLEQAGIIRQTLVQRRDGQTTYERVPTEGRH
jgi:predicted transcriptional regulator